MKIHLRQIRPEGLELDESFSPEWVGLTRKDSIRFSEPVEVKAKVTRADDEVFVRIKAKSAYESFCYRCLEDQSSQWSTDFTLTLDVDKHTEFIDIAEDIRQELILNLPGQILCREDCKGLCIDCGVNLNTQECEHKHSVAKSKL